MKMEILTFLKEKLEEASGKSKHFVNCTIAGIKTSKKDGVEIETEYFSYQLCPDQYVGKVCLKKEQWVRKPILNDNGEINIPKNSVGIVIFVLESPHKYEFDKKHMLQLVQQKEKREATLPR